MTHRHIPLDSRWTLHATGPVPVRLPADGLPATVPGCVHTDLLAAGLIEDPYLDDNEERLHWIGRADWTYRTVFDWAQDGAEAADLVFEGLDTVAEVELNGVRIGSTANQHRSYRFPVRALLRPGPNQLSIRFTSPYTYARELRERLGDRPGAYAEPYQFLRKMACNFGWDWGPTVVTSGVWRPVALETWSGARLDSVRVLGGVGEDGVPRLQVEAGLERASVEGPLRAEVEVAGVRGELRFAAGAARARTEFAVPGAERWWPRGHGEQPLYEVVVRLGESEWRTRTGFRTVGLERDAFRISVNDRALFVRGVNWIPEDCFPSRVTRERVAARLDQAVAAGVNLVRVWGGGLYESRDFYELCDERGLLVWQDFPFACAAYPEEQPLWDEVAAEARENVIRLAPHPSLVLWCGNNENLEGHADWGWQERLDGRTWGAGYYHELLPGIVAEHDPSRPYWPGTPYSGEPGRPPQDPAHGTVHVWDVWNREDWTAYADRVPRFVAEFGFQGPPAHATLRRAIQGELTPGEGLLAHHQKAEGGDAKLLAGLGAHLPAPTGYADWHWLTQLNQARAIDFGIRHFRSHSPYCMGTVLWQLNDCWPVVSWAAIDGDGRPKPLWYALREVYADRMLAVRDGGVVAVNDTDAPWQGPLRLRRHALDGTLLAEEELEVRAAARATAHTALPAAVAEAGDARRELLVVDLAGTRYVHFYDADAHAALPAARFTAQVSAEEEAGARGAVQVVTVTAHTLLRELALFPDRLDPAARVDRMLVTLLPGESTRFRVTGGSFADPSALTRPPVLRCANDVPSA